MIALALAAALLAGGPAPAAAAPPPFDRDCMDDYGRDLCDPAVRARIRGKFGVQAAEDLAGRGVEGVRVFLVDGYSNDMPLVSILREPGKPAAIEVRAADKPPRVLSEPATAWQWTIAGAISSLARAAPEKVNRRKDDIPLCMHAWVTVTEAIHGGVVTTRVRNACDGEALFDGGVSLTRLAVDGFEGCGELRTQRYGGVAAQLSDCTRIRGGFQAMGLYNAFNASPAGPGFARSTVAPDSWLAAEATLVWLGRTSIGGRDAIAGFWEEQRKVGRIEVVMTDIDPTSEAGVYLVRGFVRRGDASGKREQAPFEQAWKVVPAAGWRVVEWAVGDFAPLPEDGG